MGKFIDITGAVFGELTVIAYEGKNSHRHSLWKCVCRCGAETVVAKQALVNGGIKSCGCLRAKQAALNGKSSARHGLSKSGTYASWSAMIQRCTNANNGSYANYGGRGISVCERWMDFMNFVADMGTKPGDEYQIDRIDNDGNYEPANCKWSTPVENCNNRRNNVVKETEIGVMTVAQYSRAKGMTYSKARHLLSRR